MLRFVTNTTSRSRPATVEKLRRLGFSLDDQELVTPAALALRHCIAEGRQRVSLLMSHEVKGDFSAPQEDEDEPEAVIVGDLGEEFAYPVLNRAFRHVMGRRADRAATEPLPLLAAGRRALARRRTIRAGARVRDGS